MFFDEIAPYRDNLQTVRRLLSYPLVNWVSQYFSYTRDAEAELLFVEMCRSVLVGADLPAAELEQYEAYLISSELAAYDRLNMICEYVNLYEWALENTSYTTDYSVTRDDPEINRFVLSQDAHIKRVHFLYSTSYRYEVMLRKRERLLAGQLDKRHLRRQKEELTEQELSVRMEYLLRRLRDFIEGSDSDGKTHTDL